MFITLIHVTLYICDVILYIHICDGAEPEKKNGKSTAYWTNIYLIGKKNRSDHRGPKGVQTLIHKIARNNEVCFLGRLHWAGCSREKSLKSRTLLRSPIVSRGTCLSQSFPAFPKHYKCVP